MGKHHICISLVICSLLAVTTVGQLRSERSQLKIERTLIDSPIIETPIIYPEKIVTGPQGQIYLLDTELDRIFLFSETSGELKPLKLRTPDKFDMADLFVDKNNTLWILDSQNNGVQAFKADGTRILTFRCSNLVRSIGVLDNGQIVVQTGTGPHLFEVYTPKGTPVKTFGERKPASSEAEGYWLNLGWMKVAGDKIYFCFAYPYEVRCYNASGTLFWTHTLPLDLPKPQISVVGSSASVNMSLSSLTIAPDRRGRIYVLVSGETRLKALDTGANRVDIISREGTIASYSLPHSYNYMSVSGARLLLLKNRKLLRIDTCALA